jgi:hypothetical protein
MRPWRYRLRAGPPRVMGPYVGLRSGQVQWCRREMTWFADQMTTAADSQSPRVITVCKQKLQGGRGCWQAYELDRDDDGIWLFTPAGSIFRFSDGQSDDRCEVEGGDGPGLGSLTFDCLSRAAPNAHEHVCSGTPSGHSMTSGWPSLKLIKAVSTAER